MVVFPAPFGPRYPNISPFSTENVISSSIFLPEKFLDRNATSITARDAHPFLREERVLSVVPGSGSDCVDRAHRDIPDIRQQDGRGRWKGHAFSNENASGIFIRSALIDSVHRLFE